MYNHKGLNRNIRCIEITSYDASILEPLTFENKPEARAVGDGGYDLDLMIKNAKKNRGMKE